MVHKTVLAVILCVLSLAELVVPSPVKTVSVRPIVFVHGLSGSGAQFESQAMRFASNGYPVDFIVSYEYNSITALQNQMDIGAGSITPADCPELQQRFAALDRQVDAVLKRTGAGKVDLVAHSLGTIEMIEYLDSSPQRAAKVAHYVSVDGWPLDHLPGGVPTLALWAGAGGTAVPGREITGATNVIIPNQTHVQTCTSAESFVQMYKFFTGKDPTTSQILPSSSGQVSLAGRAILFPDNTGVQGATLEIYSIRRDTGARTGVTPDAVFSIGQDGNWGPFTAKSGSPYEFVLVRGESRHHFYFEPWTRSDHLVRLLTSPVGEGIDVIMTRNDHQSDLVIGRNKEFWGDQGSNNDTLTINGTNVVNAAVCPQERSAGGISMGVCDLFIYDQGDQKSNPGQPISDFAAIPFLTGVDLYLPGATPPDGTISCVLTPRGGNGKQQVINVPNWASTHDIMSVQFNDYVQ